MPELTTLLSDTVSADVEIPIVDETLIYDASSTGAGKIMSEFHDHDHHSWDKATLREQAAGFRFGAQAHTDTIGAIKDTRFDLAGVVDRAAAAAALASANIAEEICETTDKVITAVTLGTAKTSDGICDLKSEVLRQGTATLVGFKDLTALTYQVEGRSLLEAAKNASALAVQADKNSAAIQLQAQTFASAAALQAQTIASAATLQAQQIAATAAAAAAECCCKLEALITGVTTDRLKDELSTMRASQAAFFARNVPPVVPVV